jgi:peptidoglycan/xylan/chitin deacetylase (PgdA/CDA1 family)
MKADGHELGNHLGRDEATILLSDEEFEQQLLAVEQMIGPLGETKWCRPGSGWFSPDMVKIAHGLGYRCCLGSIYPFDNKLRRPGWIKSTVMDRIYPGAIVVLHEGGSERDYIVPLLGELIPELKAGGYEFLTLSEIQKLDRR